MQPPRLPRKQTNYDGEGERGFGSGDGRGEDGAGDEVPQADRSGDRGGDAD